MSSPPASSQRILVAGRTPMQRTGQIFRKAIEREHETQEGKVILVPESGGMLCNPRLTSLEETPRGDGRKGPSSHPAREVMTTLQREIIHSEL